MTPLETLIAAARQREAEREAERERLALAEHERKQQECIAEMRRLLAESFGDNLTDLLGIQVRCDGSANPQAFAEIPIPDDEPILLTGGYEYSYRRWCWSVDSQTLHAYHDSQERNLDLLLITIDGILNRRAAAAAVADLDPALTRREQVQFSEVYHTLRADGLSRREAADLARRDIEQTRAARTHSVDDDDLPFSAMTC